jgi:hypothetical protein
MTALEALKAAHAAGIKLKMDGDFLVLQATTPPPATVVDLLSRHKAEVLALLTAREYENDENRLLAPLARSKTEGLLPEGEPNLERPCSDRRGRILEFGGALLHFCVECGRFGPYGYDVRLRTRKFGRWYCYEHRPQELTR